MRMLFLKIKKIIFVLVFCFFLLAATEIKAATLGEVVNFNIDSSYDLYGRKETSATLVKITNQLYFYADKNWWQKLDYSKKQSLDVGFYSLAYEFERNIYPTLTSIFGSEPKPGIDNDERIIVLVHPIISEAGGYFRSNDEYPRLQAPDSNEREMVYLNSQYIDKPEAKTFLAHEFTHLITVEQKDLRFGVTEETWLDEARAEYVSTLLGYDGIYKGSNLEKRVKAFLEKPSDSLTEWQNKKEDYGAVDLFIQYLVDQYGVKILVDSLRSSKAGIPSINEALKKNGFTEDFAQVFTNWTMAVLVNDCKLGKRYCYLSENLKDLRIIPNLYYLPLRTESILSTFYTTTNWSPNWHKFIGGNNVLKLEFSTSATLNFQIPYLIQDKDGNYTINFLKLDKNQKGEINITDFGGQYKSLTIIPSLQTKTEGFNGIEPTYPFTFTVSISGQQIIPNENPLIPAGFTFNKNLYYGMRDQNVIYLKIMLTSEGCLSGVANTNYFATKTLAAVKCFQNKYKSQISQAAGYQIKATGFVGAGTRTQLNLLLNQ